MARPGEWLRLIWVALTSRTTQRFYDRIAPFYDMVFVEHRTHAEKIVAVFSESNDEALKALPVLDLACGTGMVSKLLAEQGFRVVGADLSLESLSVLKQQADSFDVVQADAAALPLKSSSIGSVACLGAWRHFPDPAAVLDELVRVMAKDGMLLIGYFPPRVAGLVDTGGGAVSRLLRWIYRMMTRLLGYHDRTDDALEEETRALLAERFEHVATVESGEHARLLLARVPKGSPA